jgi:hypothetical protein
MAISCSYSKVLIERAKAMSMKRLISAAHGFRQTKVRTYLGAHPFKAAGLAWEG